jgi:pimeloyl-ACP methyl ester carboxylesterase
MLFKKNSRVFAEATQPGKLMKFFKTQQHADTVVFVHGILGHYITSWGEFPRLLSEDPDLPDVDVLLWGYPTGWVKPHNELEAEGKHLITALHAFVRSENAIVLVGHSMGGLIILKGLVDRMIGGHAQTHPCGAVCWITLFASPLNGAWAAGLARRIAGPFLRVLRTLHKHLRDLSRGDFVDRLLAETVNRIYRPGPEDSTNRRIPIRIVAATRDGAVDRSNRDSALAVYRDPEPHQLDETHSSVKLPTHVGDLRYRVLFNDLQLAFARKFRKLCIAATDMGSTAELRESALSEMQRRYGRMLRRRVRDVVRRAELFDSAEAELLLLIAFDGAAKGLPPFDTANRAISALASRHKNWK